MGAFYQNEVREAIKDQMAEIGMTEEDLRELVRKLESPARDRRKGWPSSLTAERTTPKAAVHPCTI